MRIAIVNDMVMAVETLRRVLMAVPEYQVAWIARNGADAVVKCAQDTPDLILMDLVMPVMDGKAFLKKLKASPRLRHIPVLLMTAQPSPPTLEVAAVLPKPFSPNSLLLLVKRFKTLKQREHALAKPGGGVAVKGVRT